MKMLGAVFVILASWGYGSVLIKRLDSHREQLSGMEELIDLFLGEIGYGKTPLKEACQQISERIREPYSGALKQMQIQLSQNRFVSFAAVWKEQIYAIRPELYLTGQEEDVLVKIGTYLGYLDTDAQERHLLMCKKETSQMAEQFGSTIKEKKKVYRCVSLLAGALVILLFV